MRLSHYRSIASMPAQPPKVAFMAVTNACTHRCVYCDIWDQPVVRRSKQDWLEAVDRLHSFGVRILLFTGGEPTLFKQLPEIISHANDRGMFCHMVTNGNRFTPEQAEAYKAAGLVGLSISMEHYDAAVLEKNRGRAGVKDNILQSLAAAQAAGLNVFAYVLISRLNLLELEEVCTRHIEAGFNGVNFCYPISGMGSTFEVGGERTGDATSVQLSPEELIAALETVRRLRHGDKVFVYNPEESIDLAIAWLEEREVKYRCLGGSRIFWLDWNLDLFVCAYRKDLIGNILDLESLPAEPSCNQCLFQGFRDISIYLQGWSSIMPLARLGMEHLRQGKFAL